MKHSKRFGVLTGLSVALVTGMSFLPVTQSAHAARSAAPVTGKVAFLFSDFTTSPRWKFDESYFKAAIHKLDPKVQVVTYDAKATQTTQDTQAKSALTAGANVIIDVPVDSVQAKVIVQDAHQNKPRVPVLAYDRLIDDVPVDAYASFNGFKVGVAQADYLKAHVAKGGTIVSIAGSPTDNNAHLFHSGAFSVLQPLFKNGTYKLGYDKYTPNWDQATAQQEMSSALNSLNNKVNGVLVANDTMGLGVITALKAQGLAGKIPVTGQDATVEGIQQILLGYQSMTVYKPIRELAAAAAKIVNLWLHHKTFKGSIKTPNGAGKVPSAIRPVVSVTKQNFNQTVIKDGYVTKAQVCNGIPANLCKLVK